LETWGPLSLDPYSNDYIEKVIGNQVENVASDNGEFYIQLSGSYPNMSQYIRVRTVNLPTPNYFDANGIAVSAYTSSIPINGSGSAGGSFTGAIGSVSSSINLYDRISTNTQGLIGASYNSMISLLGNPEAYQFNLLFVDVRSSLIFFSCLFSTPNFCATKIASSSLISSFFATIICFIFLNILNIILILVILLLQHNQISILEAKIHHLHDHIYDMQIQELEPYCLEAY
jgi:hypothetical protein